MFYAVPEKAKALRVHRFLPVPGVSKSTEARDRAILELTSRLQDKEWTAAAATPAAKEVPEIAIMAKTIAAAGAADLKPVETGVAALTAVAKLPAPKAAAGTEAAGNGATNGKKSYGVSDDFDDMDKPAAAPPQGQQEAGDAYQNAISAEERAALPPLYEGDEFAIEDLDRVPVFAGQNYAAQSQAGGMAGFAGTDADLSAVVPTIEGGEEVEDISAIMLPEDITAILAQSAKKLNEGLRGKADGK